MGESKYEPRCSVATDQIVATPAAPTHADPEKLPFFGPPDPTRWPIHKKFFLGGILFPPFWFVGAFLPVRDAHDNCTLYTHAASPICY